MTDLGKSNVLLSVDERTLTIRIPLQLRRIGGRKAVIAPDTNDEWATVTNEQSGALLKAIVRAFRWQKMLDERVYSSADELAAAEKLNPSYVSRILRLSLLAPAIVEAVLNGRHLEELSLAALLKPFPYSWLEQRRCLTERNQLDE